MIEFAFAAYIATRTPVTDVVADRIFAEQAEQGLPRPLLVYRLLPGSKRHYHSGGASGLVEADIELVCQGQTYKQARQLYEVIRNEIDGFKGMWGDTEIDRATLTPPASNSFPPIHGDETGFPSVRAVLETFYIESIPALGSV